MIEVVNNNDDELISVLQSSFREVYKDNNALKNEFINNPYTKIFIYREDDDILGLIHINDIYDRYEINNFYVIDKYRNRGIGSLLLEKVIELGKKQKIKNITLEVRKNNILAISLYENYGFIAKSIRKGYYNGTDGILMEKEMIG